VAARAASAGAGAVIVIDLARVGTGTGLDLALIARVREAAPQVTLLAGGGVRGPEDLARLADSGCDGALVATALHDGRLGAAEVAAAERLGRPLDGGLEA
jgi:phosphoribosylformimino-5-aminoimidazole carboxamide ribotide isomerase